MQMIVSVMPQVSFLFSRILTLIYLIHSSSDGQKYETQIHTLQSRHSSKYFGMNKGITSYTMVANHIPIQARIIGANEHESHYVFDILYNNTTNIKAYYPFYRYTRNE